MSCKKSLHFKQARLSCLQDMNNTNLSNSPGKVSGGGYRAPGGPVSSSPFSKVQAVDLSPRPSTPTSPSNHRAQPSVTMSPSSSFNQSFVDGGTMSSSAGGPGMYLDPQLLVDKSPSELPQGVEPTQKEVGAELLYGSAASDIKTCKSSRARCHDLCEFYKHRQMIKRVHRAPGPVLLCKVLKFHHRQSQESDKSVDGLIMFLLLFLIRVFFNIELYQIQSNICFSWLSFILQLQSILTLW